MGCNAMIAAAAAATTWNIGKGIGFILTFDGQAVKAGFLGWILWAWEEVRSKVG